MIETITEFFNQAMGFITSGEFQAFTTATIGLVTSIALIQNRVAALKVSKTENVMLAQNIEINTLEKKLVKLESTNDLMTKKLDTLSGMFALVFLNSKKLDAATKQELIKHVDALQAKTVEQANSQPLFEKVAEVVKTVSEVKVVEQVAESVTDLYKKLTKV
jgi:hypothetical protein